MRFFFQLAERGRYRLVPKVVLAVLLALVSSRLMAKPPPRGKAPPPPPPKVSPHVAEMHRLAAEIEKLKAAEFAALSKVQAAYFIQVAKLNLPALHAEIRRLHKEERAALWKLLDPAKVAAIRAKYRPQILVLEKEIQALATKMAELNGRKKSELAKIRSAYASQLAKLDPPEDRLEHQLERVIAAERGEFFKLINPSKVAQIRAEFSPTIDDLKQRIRAKEALMASLERQKKKQIAAIESFYRARAPKADPSEERLEVQLVRLVEARRYELENTSDPQMSGDINAAFDRKIAALRERIREADSQRTASSQEERDRIERIAGQFRDEIAKIDRPEDRLEARLADVRARERAAIHKLIDPAKVKAIEAKYRPRIDVLSKQIRVKEEQMSRITGAMHAALEKVDAAYRGKFIKLDRPEDKLEYKLIRLRERERLEIMRLIDVAKVKSIHAKYDPTIAALVKHLHAQRRQLIPIGERAYAAMNRITADFHRRIAPLQTRMFQLMAHASR